jgi:hypothetical protein
MPNNKSYVYPDSYKHNQSSLTMWTQKKCESVRAQAHAASSYENLCFLTVAFALLRLCRLSFAFARLMLTFITFAFALLRLCRLSFAFARLRLCRLTFAFALLRLCRLSFGLLRLRLSSLLGLLGKLSSAGRWPLHLPLRFGLRRQDFFRLTFAFDLADPLASPLAFLLGGACCACCKLSSLLGLLGKLLSIVVLLLLLIFVPIGPICIQHFVVVLMLVDLAAAAAAVVGPWCPPIL